jgi:hypothetical protein
MAFLVISCWFLLVWAFRAQRQCDAIMNQSGALGQTFAQQLPS